MGSRRINRRKGQKRKSSSHEEAGQHGNKKRTNKAGQDHRGFHHFFLTGLTALLQSTCLPARFLIIIPHPLLT